MAELSNLNRFKIKHFGRLHSIENYTAGDSNRKGRYHFRNTIEADTESRGLQQIHPNDLVVGEVVIYSIRDGPSYEVHVRKIQTDTIVLALSPLSRPLLTPSFSSSVVNSNGSQIMYRMHNTEPRLMRLMPGEIFTIDKRDNNFLYMLFRKLNVAQDSLVTPNITARNNKKRGTKKRKRNNNGNNNNR